jgi:hypothetical protein
MTGGVPGHGAAALPSLGRGAPQPPPRGDGPRPGGHGVELAPARLDAAAGRAAGPAGPGPRPPGPVRPRAGGGPGRRGRRGRRAGLLWRGHLRDGGRLPGRDPRPGGGPPRGPVGRPGAGLRRPARTAGLPFEPDAERAIVAATSAGSGGGAMRWSVSAGWCPRRPPAASTAGPTSSCGASASPPGGGPCPRADRRRRPPSSATPRGTAARRASPRTGGRRPMASTRSRTDAPACPPGPGRSPRACGRGRPARRCGRGGQPAGAGLEELATIGPAGTHGRRPPDSGRGA